MSLAERLGTSPTVFLEDLFEGAADVSGATEFTIADYATQICASGFPEINRLTPRFRWPALEGYAQRVIDRDIPELGARVRHPASLRAWLTAYAAASSTTATYTAILEAATAGETDKPARATVQVYRELLAKLWILEPVPAWTPAMTPLRRLTKGEKHQLCDVGLAAHLLGLSEQKLMGGARGSGEVFGQLFESLATLGVRAAALRSRAQVYHLRTRDTQHEVDLIVERFDGSVIGVEVKLARTVENRDVAHLHWLGEQLGDRLVDKVVLNAGSSAYRRLDGVAVIPLAMFG